MLQDETQLLRLSETKDMVYLNKKFDVFAHDIDTVTLSQLDNSGNLTDGQISVAGYVSGFVLTKIKKLHKYIITKYNVSTNIKNNACNKYR